MNKEEIIEESIDGIRRILGIIKTEISLIEGKSNSKKEIEGDLIEEGIRIHILYAQKSYLDFYKKIVEFLYKKLDEKAPDEDFFFFIPLLRTQIEIYACLLYLCFQPKNKQMTLAIMDTLSTIAKMNSEGISKEVTLKYKENYKKFKPFIDRENMSIPDDPKDLSTTWLKKSGYDYPSVVDMLSEKCIKESSPQMSQYLKNGTGRPYYLYSLFSNYVHGNLLSNYIYGREKFWIISSTLTISGQISELVNIKILSNSQRKDITDWLNKISTNYPKLLKVWNSQKIP